jgi:hypothetical protein
LTFELNGYQVWAIHHDLETMVLSMVTNDVFTIGCLQVGVPFLDVITSNFFI